MRAALVLAFVLALPSVALAHTEVGDASGFMHGVMHPLGGLDHVLAMVAVGVLAVVLGGRALYLVPLSFIAMMGVGFALGILQVDLPFVELGIGLSSVAIGGAAALGRPMPVPAAMALVGVFAVFHGHAHGAEMPESAGGLAYVAGFVVATAGLHLAGLFGAVGAAHLVGRHGRRLAQAVGAVFALGGVGVLAGWL